MRALKIYVASSWRNFLQQGIVVALRRSGHEVYDFKHPAPGNNGFRWTDVDPSLPQTADGKAAPWTAEQTRKALASSVAIDGYTLDMSALEWCDACVMVLPAGRSASWELGYAMGQGKAAYVVQLDEKEPELMFMGANILGSMNELFDVFGEPTEAGGSLAYARPGEGKWAPSPEIPLRGVKPSFGDPAERAFNPNANAPPIEYPLATPHVAFVQRTTEPSKTRYGVVGVETKEICVTCAHVLASDPTRHFKECERRAEFPKASTDPCPGCGGSGRVKP